jgi:hypothetical protein
MTEAASCRSKPQITSTHFRSKLWGLDSLGSQITTITYGDGAPDRLVNLYRGRGGPLGLEGGRGVGSVSKRPQICLR